MGFESCHPAVNFIFFAAALYGTVCFNHRYFLRLPISALLPTASDAAESRAVAFNLCLLPLILVFALYYSSYHHFGVTVLRQNFIGNNLTVESFVYGLVIGLRFATLCMWLEAMFRVVSSDKVVYLFGRVSRGCPYSSRSCCDSFPESVGRQGKSTSPKRELAVAAIRAMSFGGLSTACGYPPC